MSPQNGGNSRAVILAVIGAALVLATVWFAWSPVLMRSASTRSGAAQAHVLLLSNACKDFYMDVGRYPRELSELLDGKGIENWDGPYLEPPRIRDDPWGRPYHYASPATPGEEPDIFCLGADNRPGGARDYHSRAKERHALRDYLSDYLWRLRHGDWGFGRMTPGPRVFLALGLVLLITIGCAIASQLRRSGHRGETP